MNYKIKLINTGKYLETDCFKIVFEEGVINRVYDNDILGDRISLYYELPKIILLKRGCNISKKIVADIESLINKVDVCMNLDAINSFLDEDYNQVNRRKILVLLDSLNVDQFKIPKIVEQYKEDILNESIEIKKKYEELNL